MSTVSRPALAAGVLCFAMALGACGSSGTSSKPAASSTSGSTSSTAAVSSTSAASGNPLASAPPPGDHFATTLSFVHLTGGGLILVGPNGHSLYVFDRDQGTTAACTGGCASAWPALTSSGAPTVAAGLDASKAGTAAGQVTYNGHLLYYFAADKAPGDTNGLSISGWHVVSPLGTAMAGR